MNIKFENKVIVITGAAGGLGKAIVQGFLDGGAKVAACDLKDTAVKLSDISSENLRCYDFDITNTNETEIAMNTIAADLGKIDVLCNNAGINVGPEQ